MAQIDSHTKFAEQLMNRYQWTDDERKPLVGAMARIKEKQEDRCLNVSVVGEFSSGKSTFINALLRHDLLEADVLQGTTVAITILEYSAQYRIRSEYDDGKSDVKTYPDLGAMRHDLIHLTTDPSEGKQLRCIYVGLPSPTLQKGFRIIDTPGTNAVELWHEEVTRRAIHDYSDMSILVTDAIKPLPKSLTSFAQQHLADSIGTSVVVVTKLDLVRERERERQKAYIQKRVNHEYGDKAPLVLYYTSIEVVNTFVPGTLEHSEPTLLEATLHSEEQLLHHTAQLRLRSQAKRLLRLTSDMYNALARQLEEEELEILVEQEELEKAKRADFTDFIAEKKAAHRQRFERRADDIRDKLATDLSIQSEKAKQNILANIQTAKTVELLKSYVKVNMQPQCEEEAKRIHKSADDSYAAMMKFARSEIKNFQKEFEQEFENLELLRFNLRHRKDQKEIVVAQRNATSHIATAYLSEETTKENIAFLGGAATGAVLGTAVLPVVGTIIGGIIGFVGGAFFAPNIEKVRQKALLQMSPSLNNYFIQVENDVTTSFKQNIAKTGYDIEKEIDKYHKEYWQEVEKYEQEWNSRRKEIEARLKKLREDQANLVQRRNNLKIIRDKLSQI